MAAIRGLLGELAEWARQQGLSGLHAVRSETAETAGINWLVNHRLEREAKVAATLEETGGGALEALVRKIYDDVDERLHSVTERPLLALLIKLREDGRAREEDHNWYPTT